MRWPAGSRQRNNDLRISGAKDVRLGAWVIKKSVLQHWWRTLSRTGEYSLQTPRDRPETLLDRRHSQPHDSSLDRRLKVWSLSTGIRRNHRANWWTIRPAAMPAA